MPPRSQAISQAVARNVHALRSRRGWSLDVLSRRSGVSKGMLVQIEQGHSNPSLGTLVRLTDAFGVSMAQLIEGEPRSEVRVVREGEAAVLWQDDAGSRAEVLLGLDRREHVELWRWRLAPGAIRGSEAHLTGTQEMAHVTEGVLTVEVAGEQHVLRVGDSMLFPADRDHAYRNESDQPARFEMVVIIPTDAAEKQ